MSQDYTNVASVGISVKIRQENQTPAQEPGLPKGYHIIIDETRTGLDATTVLLAAGAVGAGVYIISRGGKK